MLRIKSLVTFLPLSLSTLFRLSSLDPNVNGVAVLDSVVEVDIFRLTFRVNVGISANGNNLMKSFDILSGTNK